MKHSQKVSQSYLICKEKRQITNSLKNVFPFSSMVYWHKNENDPFHSPGITNLFLLIKYLLTLIVQSKDTIVVLTHCSE